MPEAFCGIDVGTQGARCMIVRGDGSVVARGECPFAERPAPLPKGWSEQEPGSWTTAVRNALRQALSSLNREPPFADRVAALSVTSTSGTLCVLDADCRPLVPAIMYNDARSSGVASEVQDAARDLTLKLGYRFGSSFALPKVLWLKRKRPDVYGRAALLTSATDYIIGWLTGNYRRSDQTNVLKFGYDLMEDRWPDFIEETLGISRALLPVVEKPGTLAGHVAAGRARELGLPPHTPVAAGMTDGCASQVAAGAVSPGQYNTTIGTTMVIKGVSRRLLLDPMGRIYCHRHPEGWWLPGGASNTGAQCLAAEFGPGETEARSAAALAHSPTHLVAYPLVGKGERFPFLSPDAERFLIGSPQDRDELFAAYLEGVACLERLAYETLEELGAQVGDTIVSAGGGSRSDAWLQMRADTLDRTVQRPAVADAAMGAAILAACLEEYGSLTDAARVMVRIEREVRPRRERVADYADKYARFVAECVSRGYLPRARPA
jgi:xylulokinase